MLFSRSSLLIVKILIVAVNSRSIEVAVSLDAISTHHGIKMRI
jgi:hypothetical protein